MNDENNYENPFTESAGTPADEPVENIPEYQEPETEPIENEPEAGYTTTSHVDYVVTDIDEDEEDEEEEPTGWSDPTYKQSEDAKFRSPNYYGEKNGYGSYSTPVYDTPKPEKKPHKARSAVALVLVCAIVCSLMSAVAAWLVIDYKVDSMGIGKQVVIGSPTVSTGENGDSTTVSHAGDKLTASQIYSLALEQVVGINSKPTKNVFGQSSNSAVSGSGFVISEDGYILTNYHVIEYCVNYNYTLEVLFNNGNSYPATIVGYEESNDVAVIKIDASGLNPVTFGSNDAMNVGDSVFPVGNPLGELTYTMTFGIISALDREISTDVSTKINMFQIDAAVNEGNSGGPVYNEYGEVIGIVTAKYLDTGVEGLGFAIPIDDVIGLVSQLIENGYISGKAYLGVVVQTMDSSFASYYNVPEGAYIREISKGSCAEKAGLRVGDIITKANGEDVGSMEDLVTILKDCSAGDTIAIEVYRSGSTVTVNATLDEKLPTAAN